MSILTTFRNKTWYNEFTIYRDSYLKSPNKPRTIANMGLAYAKSGDEDKARRLFYEAISKGTRFSEEYVASANNILTSLIKENKYEEAMIEGERLYKNIPPNANIIGMPTFLYTLGLVYQKNQKLELALESFKEALRLRNDPTKYLYIYDATLSIAIEISQEKSRQNLVKIKSKNEDILFGLETLFNVAMECRDYKLAIAALAKIKDISPGKHQELSATIDDITKRNNKSLSISDIAQHKNYITDSHYRNKIKSMSFINKHYFPLKFLARNILTTMKSDYPDDPFVLELHVGTNYIDYLTSPEKITEVDNLIKKHSDFPPLLSLSAKLYLATGDNEKALATISRLLDIYPAHPHWLYWEQMKTKLNMKKNENRKKNDGTQIGHDPSAGL